MSMTRNEKSRAKRKKECKYTNNTPLYHAKVKFPHATPTPRSSHQRIYGKERPSRMDANAPPLPAKVLENPRGRTSMIGVLTICRNKQVGMTFE